MINFNYEIDFNLENEEVFFNWLSVVIVFEKKNEGEINYIFCDDEYFYKINVEYLDYDILIDIISFDYIVGNELNGDIFVFVERVEDNVKDFNVFFDEELKWVLVYGILYYCGYKDKIDKDVELMCFKEDEKIEMFYVEL